MSDTHFILNSSFWWTCYSFHVLAVRIFFISIMAFLNTTTDSTTTFSHAIHITFCRFGEEDIPWHVSITSVTATGFKSLMIGLSTEDLVFDYEDWKKNCQTVDNFPRPAKFPLDYKFKLEDFAKNLHNIYVCTLGEGDWCPETMALDCPTYHYLLKNVPSFNLKFQSSNPDDRTLAAVYRQSIEKKKIESNIFWIAIHVTFIRYQGGSIPWYISMTTSDLKTYFIGLSTKSLKKMTYEDAEYNSLMVENFPRPDSFKMDYVFEIDEFQNNFYDIYMDFWNDERVPNIVVLDEPTYHYLLNIFPFEDLSLIHSTISEDKTLAAMYRQSVTKKKSKMYI